VLCGAGCLAKGRNRDCRSDGMEVRRLKI
jgi:hypothetical protein